MNLQIVGDGLAGLMLAHHLLQEGHELVVHGDAQTNTPPVGLVHLFAGRSFCRSELELEVFAEAIRHWRAEPLAQEYPVRRKLYPGTRLERSLEDADLPPCWTPLRLEGDWVEYSPAFSISSKALEERLRHELQGRYRCGHKEPGELSGMRILALGGEAPKLSDALPWDLSQGRTVEARSEGRDHVVIGGGLHRAPFPERDSVVLGGRSTARGIAPEDELKFACDLTQLPHSEISIWSGRRCAVEDHRPVLGFLDPSTFVFVGFGSRALFWLPYCVKLASAALRGQAVPPQLDLLRWGRF